MGGAYKSINVEIGFKLRTSLLATMVVTDGFCFGTTSPTASIGYAITGRSNHKTNIIIIPQVAYEKHMISAVLREDKYHSQSVILKTKVVFINENWLDFGHVTITPYFTLFGDNVYDYSGNDYGRSLFSGWVSGIPRTFGIMFSLGRLFEY